VREDRSDRCDGMTISPLMGPTMTRLGWLFEIGFDCVGGNVSHILSGRIADTEEMRRLRSWPLVILNITYCILTRFELQVVDTREHVWHLNEFCGVIRVLLPDVEDFPGMSLTFRAPPSQRWTGSLNSTTTLSELMLGLLFSENSPQTRPPGLRCQQR